MNPMTLKQLFLSVKKTVIKYRVYLVLLVLFLPAVFDLLKPQYFPMHDDLQILRLQQMRECFADHQFPCRWIPDAGFGYGYPMFNYYPPLPYYFAIILNFVGMDYFWAIKFTFLLSFVLSGVFMYQLAKKFFGDLAGVVASVFYLYAPYHSVDVYVRGAMNEAWGLTFFPLILLYAYCLITEKKRLYIPLFSLSLAFLLTSHNVMTLIFAPIAIVWSVFWILYSKQYKQVIPLALAGVLGVGLAGFFFIPVTLEKSLVHVESMTVGYFNYLAHFADAKQLFLSRFWGYGGSTWGPEDDMAFPLGHLHWITSFVVLLPVGLMFLKDRKKYFKIAFLTVFFFMTAYLYAFLTHSRSVWFWDHLPLLYFAQFPWRLLAIPALCFSFLAGILVYVSNKKYQSALASIMIFAVIAINLPFFRIERQVRVTTPEKLSGALWELQVTGGIFDYLPQTAKRPPGAPASYKPQFIKGNGSAFNVVKGSNWQTYSLTVTEDDSLVRLPIFEYPKTVVTSGGKVLAHSWDTDLGRVEVPLSKGEYKLKVEIQNTPVRIMANITTMLSILVLIYLIRRYRYEY
jgi:hypothetical protein